MTESNDFDSLVKPNKNQVYTREYIIQCIKYEFVTFLCDVPFRKPKHRQIRQIQPVLITTENAWSQNRKSDDEFEEMKKQSLSLLNKLSMPSSLLSSYSSEEERHKATIRRDASMEKYNLICEKFIGIMNTHIFTEKQLNIFIPNIYIIVQKQLLYNNTFSRMFKKYNNKEFNNILIKHITKEFLISIEEIEDDRNITSMLEDPENIKKRYALNNISFIIDLYNIRVIDKEKINSIIEKLINLKKIDYLCYFSKNFFATHKSDFYNEIINFLKETSKDKQYESKTRFQCMDVLDVIC